MENNTIQRLSVVVIIIIIIINLILLSPLKGGRNVLMSPPCLESQGFQFEVTFLYLFVLLPSPVALSV